MKKALYIFDNFGFKIGTIYSSADQARVASLVDVFAPFQKSNILEANPSLLKDVEIILSGWQGAKMDSAFLAAAPKLEAVFYAAGSIRYITPPEFWDSGVIICSAWVAGGLPVAEFTLAQIILCLKQTYHSMALMKKHQPFNIFDDDIVGVYRSTVGIISLGIIGRQVANLLRNFEVKVLAYDPYVTAGEAAEIGVELVSLDDIFTRSDVVSLHTPWLKETENMIHAHHFESMKKNAAFINTARGAVVCENEMIEVLQKRPDLYAVLDVTHPHEPPEKSSPLWTLPNVVLTPHMAGTVGKEMQRQGEYMVDELGRYLRGEPLKWQISAEKARIMA